jgi:hypothetical protein
VPPGGCPGKTTPLPSKPVGGSQGGTTDPEYRAPWEKDWPKESVAYIRVQPKSWDELEDDEDASEYTYIYEDRIVHIWESNEYDHAGQEEEDETARAKIIWERLKPASDWFFCHTDGSRIGDGEHISHHARIIIGLRDEVDPEWWNKAMESVSPPSHWKEEESDNSNLEFTQSDCLTPARLAQPGAEAQADGDKDYVLKGRNAFIRVVPRAESTLDGDDSCYAVTYVHGGREITVWESYEFDDPDQWKEDMKIRSCVIHDCLGFSSDFVYRHLDGSEFEAGATVPHRSRVLIVQIPDPEPVQPECLAPARLDQPGATVQVRDGKDATQEEVSEDSRGKSASCTAVESLRSDLETLRDAIPDTIRAVITFRKQSVQMFFTPENAIADFCRKVKELWNIPRKLFYLLINGVHEDSHWKPRADLNSVQVKVKGLLGGSPIRYNYYTRYEGKRNRGSGPITMTAKEIADRQRFPLEGLRVNHAGHVFPLTATLEDILGEEARGTLKFEKGRIHEIQVEYPGAAGKVLEKENNPLQT